MDVSSSKLNADCSFPDEPSNLTQQSLLNRITTRIRQSLELNEILSATVAEVRAFLGTDRVKVYKFFPDGHGLVIAESIREDRLPSLLGLNFPADDIPLPARELFLKARQRSVVDLSTQQIGFSPLNCTETGSELEDHDIRFRPIDPCHVEYLKAMGVQSSVVVPIVIEQSTFEQVNIEAGALTGLNKGQRLWGLLVSHHAQPRQVEEAELELIQAVVDQMAVAIGQATLLDRVREQAAQEAGVNRVTALLYTKPTVPLEIALTEMVAVMQGTGGRLYLSHTASEQSAELYCCGDQPARLDHDRLIEENALWQNYLHSTQAVEITDAESRPWSVDWMRKNYSLSPQVRSSTRSNTVWAIADIYREPLFRVLSPAFQSTPIRGVMILPLYFDTELLGCITIFRDEVEEELRWAGFHHPDSRQLAPRQSFEAWRQIKSGQSQPWTDAEIRLAEALGERFSGAINQYQLYQQVQTLNTHLEEQIKERTAELHRSTAIANQQRALTNILSKLQKALDLDTIFQTTTQEAQRLLDVDHVAVYQFDEDWGGSFIHDFRAVKPKWEQIVYSTREVWNDSHLQETKGGRYRHHHVSVVNDVSQAGFSPCHLETYNYYQIKAFLIAPVFVGSRLWGLIGAYQHSNPYEWQPLEVDFITQLATHLGVAVQQAGATEKVQNQAQQLAIIAEQQHTLTNVISKIRESLDLETIFATTTREVRRLLQVERVVVFQFLPGAKYSQGEVVAEDVHPDYRSILGYDVKGDCFQDRYTASPGTHQVFAIDDLNTCNLHPCYIEMMQGLQVQAHLVVPLFRSNILWGLLAIHQCSAPRQWQVKEREFAIQISTQLGVALQQTEFLRQAQQSKESADAASQAKSDFLSHMSHELRTPLNAILGYVEIMQRDPELRDTQTEQLGIIGRSGEHLLSLINDVLEMSRIEAGQLALTQVSFDLYRLLDSLQDMLEAKAELQRLQLQFERTAIVPQFVFADEGKLRQVLINLLGNGLNYTEKGQVLLQVDTSEQIGQRGDTCQLTFAVMDTGPGLKTSDIDQLFEAFTQTDSGYRAQEGTGLGLPISRRFVQLMGGDIEVDSTVGQGSTFRFTIPATLVDAAEVHTVKPARQVVALAAGQPTYRLLIVEDKWANRQLMQQWLAPFGFDIREAVNGKEALAIWQEWAPHLIWMDMRMPVMDGYKATREIKAQCGDNPPVIIALTANAFEEDRLYALSVGCDDFVRKPCQESTILDKIAEHLGVQYIYTEPEQSEPDALQEMESVHPEDLKILVADDNTLNQQLMVQRLVHLGYSADVVGDGQQVVEACQNQTYDLILLDVQMPKMNGLEVVQSLHQQGIRPYIIGVSGRTLPEERQECLDAGMSNYLCKPVSLDELKTALSQYRPLSETSLPKDVKPALLEQSAIQTLIDIGGDDGGSFLVSVIDNFLKDAKPMFEGLQDAIANTNHVQINEIAHSLKSMSASMGATQLTQQLKELEHMSKLENLTISPTWMNKLNQEFEAVGLALTLEKQNYQTSSVVSS